MVKWKMSWSLPIALKEKFSTTWTQYLEMLANSDFTFIGDKMLKDPVLIRNEDSDAVVEPWEFVLSVLGEEEAVEKDGELKLFPVFLSLPSVFQLRFIFCLQSNILRVSSHSMNSFLLKIDNSQNNFWVKEAVRQLKNTYLWSSAETDTCTIKEQASTVYEFTCESQKVFQDTLRKLRDGKGWPWQKNPAFLNLDREKCETEVAELVVQNITPSNTHHTEKRMDVIIIDEDSTDDATAVKDQPPAKNVNKQYQSNFNKLDKTVENDIVKSDTVCTMENKLRNERSKKPVGNESNAASNSGSSAEQIHYVPDKPHIMNCEHFSAESNISGFTMKHLKERKRKFKETLSEPGDLIEYHVEDQSKFAKKINKVETAEVRSTIQTKALFQPDSAADPEIMLTGNVMVCLDSIREACTTKENSFAMEKDVMNCFLEMDVAEIKMACSYLALPRFSEKALVNFCDNMPWSSLGNESSTVFLDSCFSFKLTDMESQASRTLMMSLDSVSRIQPKALINVLVNILKGTQSDEFQCHMLTSVCKDFLPSDCFGYLIRKLSMEDLPMNEHLVTVLQTILDKRADLDTDSLNCFHSMLATAPQEVSSSAKFGKVLMGFLTKYIKKMSSQQFITICALIETHNSSFRKPLLALVKRFT